MLLSGLRRGLRSLVLGQRHERRHHRSGSGDHRRRTGKHHRHHGRWTHFGHHYRRAGHHGTYDGTFCDHWTHHWRRLGPEHSHAHRHHRNHHGRRRIDADRRARAPPAGVPPEPLSALLSALQHLPVTCMRRAKYRLPDDLICRQICCTLVNSQLTKCKSVFFCCIVHHLSRRSFRSQHISFATI